MTILERTGVGCAASGKSGGFLAFDWCDGTPLQALARRSFGLHAELAETLGGHEWGYRRLSAYAATAGGGAADRTRHDARPTWLAAGVRVQSRIASEETAAQVQPAAFTTALMRAARAQGAELRIGAVTGLLRRDRDGPVTGVRVEGDELPADSVVIAMGPWSAVAAEWLPLPPVHGLKGHSLVFETGADVPAEAVFLDYVDRDGTTHFPEIFPRADGTTYVCGVSSEAALPADPATVGADPGAFDRLHAMCREISPALAAAKVVARQACHRPVTADGLPLIGAVPGVPGAYVATGHSVWGMLNAPATGEALAQAIVDGTAHSVDLASFDPARLRPRRPGLGEGAGYHRR